MSKYHNRKTYVGEIQFDSNHEAKRYVELSLMERAGEIRDLKLQVPFELIPEMRDEKNRVIRKTVYIADFTYYDRDGNFIVEDAKGVRTEAYRIKKKLMYWRHKIKIREV